MHLFVECPHVRRVWERVAVLASAHSLDPATWGAPTRAVDCLGGLSPGLPAAEASRVRSWSLLVLWQIWLERTPHFSAGYFFGGHHRHQDQRRGGCLGLGRREDLSTPRVVPFVSFSFYQQVLAKSAGSCV
jgi:hypothetical protein